MLTVSDSRFLFHYLKFWSNFYIFPFEVDPLSGRIYNLSPLRATIWKVLYYLSVIHSMYNFTSTLVLYTFYPETAVLYHLPVVFVGAVAPFLNHLSYKPAFLINDQVFKRVFNELFDKEQSRGSPHKWNELNIKEFLGIYGMNVMLSCATVGYFIVICVEFNMSHLIINIGPFKPFRSNVIFIVSAYIFEAYASAMYMINGGIFLSLNFLVVSKVEADMDDMRTNLRRCWRNMRGIRGIACTLKQNQMYVQFFNIINASFLHVSKAGLILGAIIGGFVGLRYQSEKLNMLFGIYVHLACIVGYCFTFQHGYSVVVRQEKAKRACLAASKSIRERDARHEVLTSLRSVKCVGLKVGGFHEIERNSPIVFIDYVESQVIGLLLAF